MRRALPLLAAASILALAACNKTGDHAGPTPPPAAKTDAAASPADAPATAAADTQAADAGRASDTESAAPGRDVAPPPATPEPPQLALAYRLGLILPADQVRPLMESHQEACELAGTLQCQVMGAEAKSEGRDKVSAELTLRATPAWMRMFRTRAEVDVKGLGGKVQEAGTDGEDLSRPIVDAEAAQRARAAERDRLRELMSRRTKTLDDTLQVEQELTRVQGEMDAAASELEAMKGRIAMQTVTVSYQSKGMIAPDGVTAPLAQAGQSFLANVVGVFAVLMTVASYLLPFALIGAPIAWWAAKRRKPATHIPASVTPHPPTP